MTNDTCAFIHAVERLTARNGAVLAIGSAETVALFKTRTLHPAENRTAVDEFEVEELHAEYALLKDEIEVVLEPKLVPWGNMTAQFRNPEGTLVALYMPVTNEAKKRFTTR